MSNGCVTWRSSLRRSPNRYLRSLCYVRFLASPSNVNGSVRFRRRHSKISLIRHFAAFLGLTPRLRGSGFAIHLGPLSKQGDRYLRMLVSHGARSVLLRAKSMNPPDRLRA